HHRPLYHEPLSHQHEHEGLHRAGLRPGRDRSSKPDIGGPKVNQSAAAVSRPRVHQPAEVLASDCGGPADVCSVTSWNELRRDAVAAERERLTNPDAEPRIPYITKVMADTEGPIVATTVFTSMLPDQIRQYVPNEFATLGADDFGF